MEIEEKGTKCQKNIFKEKRKKEKEKNIREGQGIIEDRNYNTLHLLKKQTKQNKTNKQKEMAQASEMAIKNKRIEKTKNTKEINNSKGRKNK